MDEPLHTISRTSPQVGTPPDDSNILFDSFLQRLRGGFRHNVRYTVFHSTPAAALATGSRLGLVYF